MGLRRLRLVWQKCHWFINELLCPWGNKGVFSL